MKQWASCYCRTSAQIKSVSLNLLSFTYQPWLHFPKDLHYTSMGKASKEIARLQNFQKLHNIMNVLFQFFIFSYLTFHLLYKFNFSSMLWPFSHVFPPWCKFPTHLFIHHAIPHLFWNLTEKKLKHFT
jgi:hypothetical protein